MKHLVNYKLFERLSDRETENFQKISDEADDIFLYFNESLDLDITSGFYGFFGGYYKISVRRNGKDDMFKRSDLRDIESKIFEFTDKLGYKLEEINASLNGDSGFTIEAVRLDQFKAYKYDEYNHVQYVFLTGKPLRQLTASQIKGRPKQK